MGYRRCMCRENICVYMQMQLRPRRRGSAILLASGLFSEWAERVDGLAAGRPLVVVVMQVV